jgi:hypothetical protein
MSRPPNVPKAVKIKNSRVFVARQIFETGAPPSVRKLAEALGYSSANSARSYEAVRKLSDDPSVQYVETTWQNYLFPIEVFEAMREADKLVLEKEGVAL